MGEEEYQALREEYQYLTISPSKVRQLAREYGMVLYGLCLESYAKLSLKK
jgi:hypothetical protein